MGRDHAGYHAGGKVLFNHRRDGAGVVHAVSQQPAGGLHVPDPEGGGADLQRVIAVRLHEGVKGPHIVVPDPRVQPHVAAAVLAHIAEVAVALRIILAGDGKPVVIALRVAVLAAEQVNDLVAAHDKGIAAAQEVIQIALADVGVKQGQARRGIHVIQQRAAQMIRFQ